jgi:hypothetical protein
VRKRSRRSTMPAWMIMRRTRRRTRMTSTRTRTTSTQTRTTSTRTRTTSTSWRVRLSNYRLVILPPSHRCIILTYHSIQPAPQTPSLEPAITPFIPVPVKSAQSLNPAVIAFTLKPKATLNPSASSFVPTTTKSAQGVNPATAIITPLPQTSDDVGVRPRRIRVRSRRQRKVVAYYTPAYLASLSNPVVPPVVTPANTSAYGAYGINPVVPPIIPPADTSAYGAYGIYPAAAPYPPPVWYQ